MGQLVGIDINDWGQGVINSIEPDLLPSAYIRGYNCALTSIGGDKAVVMKRKGCHCLNTTPVTGSTAVVGQHEFRLASGASFTAYHLLVSDSGRLDKVSTTGTLTTISATAFTSSSTQANLPDFADANNLCFIVNGTDAKKFDGTNVLTFGIVKPSTAPTLADSGVAGNHNGTYEARVTFYNSVTGHESSAGATSATVTVANKQINWTALPLSADGQVTSRKLYLRNTATQQNFYLVTTIADNTATTYTSNISDTALTVIGPDAFENDPPPAGIRYASWHRARMFVADGQNIYFSKIELPEAFDPDAYEPINPDDGQAITGLLSAFDILIIFKSNSVWAIVGDDPDTWTITQLNPSLGCTAHRSVVFADNRVFFWTPQGPAAMTRDGNATLLAPAYISETVSSDNLNFSITYLGKICVAADDTFQRIMWAVPGHGQSRNTIILPYNYRIDRWESDKWDPMDVASMAAVLNTDGRRTVMLGGYSGQVFDWWNTSNDGVVSGTVTGTFVATSNSVSIITDGSALFDTTGGKLIERKVTIVNEDGEMVGITRPRITANTTTALTLATAVSGLVIGATYTYYIGGPAFDWRTFWSNFGKPFIKKRFRFIYLDVRPASASVTALVSACIDYQNRDCVDKAFAFTTSDQSGTWDVSHWDEFLWDVILNIVPKRFRVSRSGGVLQVWVRQYAPNADLSVHKIGMTAELLSEKLS